MVNTEIAVLGNKKKAAVFIDKINFEQKYETCPPHKHQMTEVQIITSGHADFKINKKTMTVNAMQMIVIPKDTYHQRCDCEQNTNVIVFQTTENTDDCKIFNIKSSLISELKNEVIALSNNTETVLPYYLGIILSEFTHLYKNAATAVMDRKFTIQEFMSLNYNKDICLSDLAKLLNLSEKQTERTIIQCTGKTFRKLLCEYRIEAAKILIQSAELSLSQIAEKVGYKSYSGFWKAYNKSE